LRYKGTDSEDKTLWINEALEWSTLDGNPRPTVSAATWFDEGTPWAVFTVEGVRLNVEVGEYIQAKGP
jgi:hypothetical protein